MSIPFEIRNVLAATDLSESSIPALGYARLLADRFSANVTVLYSDPIVYPIDMIGPGNGVFIAPPPEHEGKLRSELSRHVAEVMAGRPYDIVIATGRPMPSILTNAEQRKADLIVVGTHLRHGWRRALLGSVSEGVLHGSRSPVLTVAGHQPVTPSIKRILCPVNFTDVARDSLRAASRLAEVFGADLVAVNVTEAGAAAQAAEDEERLHNWIAPQIETKCSWRSLIIHGDPAERVLDCAEGIGADLLIIGAQHKLFRDATVLGTTTERLIRFSSCPVLVVPRQVAAASVKARSERDLVAAQW
ncbi:MAG TPA: universal stress protein [Thermoanaerobaculia bacterium]|nr:universal stress protein [Thermoanaerobaculia bacterium]